MSEQPPVRRSEERGIAVLTLDSPRTRNALSAGTIAELLDALAGAAADPAVRAIVLTHAGGVFCSGADLSEATGSGPRDEGPGDEGLGDEGRRRQPTGPGGLVELLRAIVELPKPVVARVEGHARAGGLGLVGACDIAVAGPGASFAFTEARLGLAPAVISAALLPRIDPRAAGRYYLTGERFDAAEAARIGLVSEAADDVDDALAPILDGLRAASPQGLAESKRLATAEVLRTFDRDAQALIEQSARLFSSAQAQEGMRAFLERRPPAWAG
jgi:enoyl-CoA hydratase